MNNNQGAVAAASANDSSEESAIRSSAVICYGLMIAGLFSGAFWLIGGLIALTKKSEASGTVYEEHFKQLVLMFWLGWLLLIPLLLMIINLRFALLFFIGAGWLLIRLIIGLLRAWNCQPYRDSD